MNEAIAAIMVPIVFFIAIAIVLSLMLFFRHRAKRDLQQTLRSAIDKGQELTPEIIERLGAPPPSPDRDLRRGIVSVAIAIAIGAFGFAVGDEDAVGPLLGIAMFPLSLGAAFLLMHFMNRR